MAQYKHTQGQYDKFNSTTHDLMNGDNGKGDGTKTPTPIIPKIKQEIVGGVKQLGSEIKGIAQEFKKDVITPVKSHLAPIKEIPSKFKTGVKKVAEEFKKDVIQKLVYTKNNPNPNKQANASQEYSSTLEKAIAAKKKS